MDYYKLGRNIYMRQYNKKKKEYEILHPETRKPRSEKQKESQRLQAINRYHNMSIEEKTLLHAKRKAKYILTRKSKRVLLTPEERRRRRCEATQRCINGKKEYYLMKSKDYREQNKEQLRTKSFQYYHANIEKCRQKNKKYRNSESGKINRIKRDKQYRDILSNSYVKKAIINNNFPLPRKMIPDELIQLTRLSIQLRRTRKCQYQH